MTDRQPGTPDEPLPDATDATEPEAEVDEEIVEAEAEDLAAGDDAEDLEDEEAAAAEEEAAAAGAAPVVAGTARERRSAAAKAAEHLPDRDRVSKIFVIVVAVAFSLILLNGIFAGRGGILTPVATETPIPSETVGPSPSAAPASSPSAAPSESPASSSSPSAPASASPAPS
jgi:hypothetical protein